ncbi:MAG TPA: hypothetical protein K8V07_20480 [Bacteroides xylanisolvens]|uniref:Uncharacterized protein n=1 Tax=Bacteroides xylanisolvens TaxID=371601 RepID=A0A921LJ80_9BACE|nr:hypothetical protein [Bacteroides xylanisolvens]
MWWIIVIGIVVIMLIRFANDSNKQANAIIKQGGMKVKYKTLINYLLSQDPNAKIVQETNTLISIGLLGISGSTIFIVSQAYGEVHIQWKVDSNVFGKHQMEWYFNEFLDQTKMIEKITNDLTVYQTNMVQKFK